MNRSVGGNSAVFLWKFDCDPRCLRFSSGQIDAAGVFAPFTLQALEGEGSKVLFDSADFPGSIPDFLVLDRAVVEERPEALDSLTGTAPTDLGPMAEKVAAFLPASGLVEAEPTMDGLFDLSFTEDHIDRQGG
jgi:hypothetical protein